MAFRLIPRDEQFFDLFRSTADEIRRAAVDLEAMLSATPIDMAKVDAIRDAEHRCDTFTHDTIQRLHRTFVTPFDREDIHALAEQLDDVVDDIYHLSEVMVIVPIDHILPEFVEQIDVLVAMAGRAVELIDRLSQMKGLRQIIDEIDELESKGDAIYRRTLQRLFSGELAPLEVIKWKDLIESAEEAIDGIEDIADIVETISFKHA